MKPEEVLDLMAKLLGEEVAGVSELPYGEVLDNLAPIVLRMVGLAARAEAEARNGPIPEGFERVPFGAFVAELARKKGPRAEGFLLGAGLQWYCSRETLDSVAQAMQSCAGED